MAHTCPSCYAYCTCNGDCDDIDFGDDPECSHCSADGRHNEDDLFPDDDEAEQNMHWTGGGCPACQDGRLDDEPCPICESGLHPASQ